MSSQIITILHSIDFWIDLHFHDSSPPRVSKIYVQFHPTLNYIIPSIIWFSDYITLISHQISSPTSHGHGQNSHGFRVSALRRGRPAGGELGLRAHGRRSAGLGGGEDVQQRAQQRAAAVASAVDGKRWGKGGENDGKLWKKNMETWIKHGKTRNKTL